MCVGSQANRGVCDVCFSVFFCAVLKCVISRVCDNSTAHTHYVGLFMFLSSLKKHGTQ